MKKLFLWTIVACLFSVATSDLSQDIFNSMDWTVDPCVDFYNFSCGGWIKNATLTPDESVYERSFSRIADFNNKILQQIINDTTIPSLSPFFQACMNTTYINSLGINPLLPYFDQITAVETMSDFSALVGSFHSLSISNLFQFFVDIDPNNPPINILQINQGGLGLPDPSLYNVSTLVQDYITHIKNMFILIGQDSITALKNANIVVQFESDLSSFTVPSDNLTDPFTLYNPVTLSQLQSLSKSFNWTSYLSSLTNPSSVPVINVVTPAFFSSLGDYLSGVSIETLKTYLTWMLINDMGDYLTDAFVNENFQFYGKILSGLEVPPPRWKSCISAVDGDLGDLLGIYFAKIAFGGSSKQQASDMVQQIEKAMTARLDTIPWMDNQTRARALEKLSLVANYIGYPDDPRVVNITITPSYFQNVIESAQNSNAKAIQSISKPADKAVWSMTADTINAYYDPTRNEMVFPAGILQSTYFNQSYPPEMNYGGAGMIMGHELTHGFDSSGRDYDGTGKLTNWWENQTAIAFQEKVQCVIDQYSKFQVLPGVYIDGTLTQGENVADMGGIKNAHDAFMALYGSVAYQPSIVQKLNRLQLLFVGFGQGWCAIARPEYLENQVKTDPHSWARFRILGPLMNFPAFAETFNCSSGSPMNPTDRCEVW